MQLQTATNSVVGYIDQRISAISGNVVEPRQYQLQVSRYNTTMPQNLWLIPGDGNLELIAPAISYYANAQIPVNAWENVHSWITAPVESITGHNGDWTVFIDTNPSFSVYTELAMVAGTHLIVPFKADDSSRVATKSALRPALRLSLTSSSRLRSLHFRFPCESSRNPTTTVPFVHR